MKLVLPQMRNNNLAIINITSIAGYMGAVSFLVFSIKGALG
jgi:NADP-dependent 3-hydroxy acid dehydrogenase YdfG